MKNIIKLIIFFLFFCWWYQNKKNIVALLLVIYSLIDLCRIAFLEKVLNPNFIGVLNVIQFFLILIACIIYVRSVIKNRNNEK